MESEPSSQSVDLAPRDAKPPHPPSPGLVAGVVVWFFGWPIVFFGCLPWVTRGDELQACLLGAGSFLWLLSCAGIYGLLLAMIEARSPATAATIETGRGLGFAIATIIQILVPK